MAEWSVCRHCRQRIMLVNEGWVHVSSATSSAWVDCRLQRMVATVAEPIDGALFDDGSPVLAGGSLFPSTLRPEVRLSDEQQATVERLFEEDEIPALGSPAARALMDASRRRYQAEVEQQEARLRAALTGRVRAAINAQMDSWQGWVSLAEDLRGEKVDAAFAEAAVGVFVEFMQQGEAGESEPDAT